MGCVFCNIVSCEEFIQGDAPAIKNPFYTPPGEERDEFIDELVVDIVDRHPEVTRKLVKRFFESPLYADKVKNQYSNENTR